MLPKFIKKSIFDKMNDGLFNFVWLKIFQLAKEGGGRARISFWQLLTFPKTNLPFWTISVTVVGRTTPVIITYQLDLQLRRAPSKIHVSNFFKWANPGLFLIYFCLFKHITYFTTNTYVKKCPSSIQCWDSISQPLEHETPPITTRPGLPPLNIFLPSLPMCLAPLG